jgi:transcriptional regulator with XRE-family HTH domain
MFGIRQREERQRLGWRQEDLARQVSERGWTADPSAFAKIEAGTRMVRLDEAVAIAETFGLLLSQMLAPSSQTELETELEAVRAEVATASAESDEALRRAVHLRNRERELIIAITDATGARE